MDYEYFKTEEIKGRYQQAVAPAVADALIEFCNQESEFEQAIEQSDKSFQECLDKVCEGMGKSISDLEVYKRAVKFYFPTADIKFSMTIDLCGDTGYEPPPIEVNKHNNKLSVSLDSLLDF